MPVLRGLIKGVPGSGKGTQTIRIRQQFPQILTLSSGDLLRQSIHEKSTIGKQVQEYISKGDLVPDHLITEMMVSQIRHIPETQSWILDGYPRTLQQAKDLDHYLSVMECNLNFVINLDVPWNIILDRIKNRYIHPASGRTYNLQFNPPKVPGKDDITGEDLVRRSDDNPDTFLARMEHYKQKTYPLLDFYGRKGILRNYRGTSSDEITPILNKELEEFFAN
ncbi:adenylate kinase-domain-containing protein [Gorgonomyces haynaldii]|nr:adenylate kinase-domain-containing protein [Gorgonomyces haynaldii]